MSFLSRVGMCALCGQLPMTWKMTCYRDVPGLDLRKGDMAGYCDRCKPFVVTQVEIADKGIVAGRTS